MAEVLESAESMLRSLEPFKTWLEPIRALVVGNDAWTGESIWEDYAAGKDLEAFRGDISFLRKQRDVLSQLLQACCVGAVQVVLRRFKRVALPSPQGALDTIAATLPEIACKNLVNLSEEIASSTVRMRTIPRCGLRAQSTRRDVAPDPTPASVPTRHSLGWRQGRSRPFRLPRTTHHLSPCNTHPPRAHPVSLPVLACSTAQDFSEFLMFLKRCKGKLPDLEENVQGIHAFYSMLKRQEVPVPDVHLAQYQMINIDLERYKLALGRAEDDKDAHISVFERDLKKEVEELNARTESASRDVTMEWILETVHIGHEAPVIEMTGNIKRSVLAITEQAARVRKYQRLFDLEVRRGHEWRMPIPRRRNPERDRLNGLYLRCAIASIGAAAGAHAPHLLCATHVFCRPCHSAGDQLPGPGQHRGGD